MILRGPFAYVLAIALLLSVAANLLVFGFVGGRMFGPPHRPGGDIERIVAIGARAFPPEIRDDIEKISEEKRDEMHARFDAVQEARQQMLETMRADPFDRDALEKAYQDLTDKTNALQAAGQDIVLQALEKASPEERAQIRASRRPPPP